MRRGLRMARIGKWTGVAVCGLIAALYLWSQWRWFYWGGSAGYIEVRHGLAIVEQHAHPLPFPLGRPGRGIGVLGQPWLLWNTQEGLVPSVSFHNDTVTVNGKPLKRVVQGASIPLWLPFAAAAALTVVLWRRDNAPASGHCRCGYDLTGNVSGRCPECGREAMCI